MGISKQYEYVISLRDKLSAPMRAAGASASATYRELIRKQQQLNSTANNFQGTIKKVIGTYIGVQAVKGFANLGIEMEQTRVAFGTFLRSAEKGNQVVEMLNQFANVTPYVNKEVMAAGRQLLAANIRAEDLTKTLNMVGDLASGANVPLTDMAAIYAKAMNKGKVQAEELNQLSERGVPILNTFAQMYGVTTAQVMKMGEQGKLTSDELTRAFQKMTSEGGIFHGLMQKQSQTTGGLISTLQGNIQYFFTKLSEGNQGPLKNLVQSLIKMSEWALRNINLIQRWAKGLLIFGSSIFVINRAIRLYNYLKGVAIIAGKLYYLTIKHTTRALVKYNKTLGATGISALAYSGFMGVASLATKAFAGSIKAVGKAIYSIPIIGWIAAAISLIVGLFKLLWERSEKFRGILFGIGEVFKTAYNNVIKPVLQLLWMLFKKYINVYVTIFKFLFKQISLGFTWLKEKVFQPLKAWFNNIGGFFGIVLKKIVSGVGKIFQPFIYLWNKVFKNNKIVMRIKEDFSKGYKKGIANYRNEKASKKANAGLFGSIGGMDSSMSSMSSMNDEISQGSNAISEGGSKPTNINITIGKLNERIEVHSTQLKESASQIENMFNELFLRVLNSSTKLSTQ